MLHVWSCTCLAPWSTSSFQRIQTGSTSFLPGSCWVTEKHFHFLRRFTNEHHDSIKSYPHVLHTIIIKHDIVLQQVDNVDVFFSQHDSLCCVTMMTNWAFRLDKRTICTWSTSLINRGEVWMWRSSPSVKIEPSTQIRYQDTRTDKAKSMSMLRLKIK